MANKKVCACGRCSGDPADVLIVGWQYLVENYPPDLPPLTPNEQSSALVSLLLNLAVRELQRTDDERIRESMRTIAARLELLAETPAEQLEGMAQYLSDEPRDAITRQ